MKPRGKLLRGFCCVVTLMAAQIATANAAPGDHACAALISRVQAVPGPAPLFLRSWDGPRGDGPVDDPALAGAAFTYDQALATIALVACGRPDLAQRVGEALLAALPANRLRNAYRAGPVTEHPVPPNGWWDAAQGHWQEDATQVGTATGNVAWAGLALLTLGDSTGAPRWRAGATHLAQWITANTADLHGPGGFIGGIEGWDSTPTRLTWKSTEHNTDAAALFSWLARRDPAWAAPAKTARHFLDAQWDSRAGRFLIGTLPDGVSPNTTLSGLDAQAWPLLLPDAPAQWRRAIHYAEQAHGVSGGFDFNDDRDGLWVEGTAQMALAYRLVGRKADADRLLTVLDGQISPGGLYWATREPRITTGLALSKDSPTADFYYYRRPHLGATAWVALAARGWNPFIGK
jgi:hypothetical protein